jgi:shikimate dehydrogenase
VTIPHKEAIPAALDEIDTVSRQIGAVNTIVNRKGRLLGSNTDWTAAVAAIESELPEGGVAGKRVALLGAGGTARAIAFGLKAKSAVTTIYNRTCERAEKLAADVGCAWAPLDAIEAADVDVIANSTSVGMYPTVDVSPVPVSVLKPGMVVFDAVYNPVWTRLLAEADKAGCRTVSGVHMFVNQAAEQFKTWTGLDAPRELMETVTRERLAALE